MSDYKIICGDCLSALRVISPEDVSCIFADPPDNIGLKYKSYKDRLAAEDYKNAMENWLHAMLLASDTVWLSFNARWLLHIASITNLMLSLHPDLQVKPCTQTFTFGQHNKHDLGNNHRPLWRFQHLGAPLYPDAIRVPSWRQLHGDKRADPKGRVPGDVFDFPRVTGNSKQRRKWCPTQLHEGLVERCLLLTTQPGDLVLDPFAGTGTTLRVCKRIGRRCILIEMDSSYCEKIAGEHGLVIEKLPGEGRAIRGHRKADKRFLMGQGTLFPLEEAA